MDRTKGRRIPNETWEGHKAIIKRLYIEEDKMLQGDKGIIGIMETNYGFRATKSQYETRLKKWGFRKYATKEEWEAVYQKVDAREAEGKESEIHLHGKLLPKDKFRKGRKRHQIGSSLLQTSREALGCIRIGTPPGRGMMVTIRGSRPATPIMQQMDNVMLHDLENSDAVMSTKPHLGDFSFNDDILNNKAAFDPGLLSTNRLRDIFSPSIPTDVTGYPTSFGEITFGQPFTSHQFETGVTLDPYQHQYHFDRINFGGLQLGTATISFLTRLNRNFFSIVRKAILDMGEIVDLASLSLQHLCAPNIYQLIHTQTPEIRIVYFIIFALSNNLFDLERLMSPRTPMEELFQRIIQYLHELDVSSLAQLLDSIPWPYSKALESSLFRTAIETGNSRILHIILKRGLNPNNELVSVEAGNYSPLERCCMLEHAEATQCLLDWGMDPSEKLLIHYCLPLPTEGNITMTKVSIFTMLLRAGMSLNNITSLERLKRCSDPRMFRACVENIHEPNYEVFIESGLLHNIIRYAEQDDAFSMVQQVLGREWDDATRNHDEFESVLLQGLYNSLLRNNMEIFEYLLIAGAEPDMRCLNRAIESQDSLLVSRLLDYGLSAIDAGPDFRRPIGVAIQTNAYTILQLFRQRGYFSTLSFDYGALCECLIAACYTGNEEIFNEILPYFQLRFYQRKTHSDWDYPIGAKTVRSAFQNGHQELVFNLFDAGFRLHLDAVQWATETGDRSLVKLFLVFTQYSRLSTASIYPAIIAGHEDVVRDLVQAGFVPERLNILHRLTPEGSQIELEESSLNIHRTESCHALVIAILAKKRVIIDLLLEVVGHRDDTFRSPIYGRPLTALCAAVRMRDEITFSKLLARDVNPYDGSALLESASKGDIIFTRRLLEASKHRHPGTRIGFGSEALKSVVEREDLEMLNTLVKHTDCNNLVFKRGDLRSGLSALGAALLNKSAKGLDMIDILLENGADVNCIVEIEGTNRECPKRTALLRATATGQLSRVQRLIRAGARIDSPAEFGITRTPFQYAVELGSEQIINYFLSLGVDVNEAPAICNGRTALQAAAGKGYIGIASLLVDRGAEINAPAGRVQGRTAFEAAAENGRLDMLFYLMEHGADIVSDGGEQYRRSVKFAKAKTNSVVIDLVEKLYATACFNAGVPLPSAVNQAF